MISSGFLEGAQSKEKPGLIPNFLARTAGMEIIFFVVTVVVMVFIYAMNLNCQGF